MYVVLCVRLARALQGCDTMAKRRPSGDGMVRKREDGRWEGRIVVGHKRTAIRFTAMCLPEHKRS